MFNNVTVDQLTLMIWLLHLTNEGGMYASDLFCTKRTSVWSEPVVIAYTY